MYLPVYYPLFNMAEKPRSGFPRLPLYWEPGGYKECNPLFYIRPVRANTKARSLCRKPGFLLFRR